MMSDEDEADLDQMIEDIAERSIEEALYEVDDEAHEIAAPEKEPAAAVSVPPAPKIPQKTEQEYELDCMNNGMVRELSNQSCGQPIPSFMADHQHPRSRNRCLLSGDDASVTELLTVGRPHSRYTMCELNDDPDLTVDSEVTDYGELFPEFGRLGGNGSCEKLRLTEDELAMEQEVDKTSDEDGRYKDGRNREDEEEEGRRKDDGRRVRCLKTVTRRTRHSSTCRTADGRTSGKIYTAKQRHIKMVSSDDGCRDEEHGGRRSKSRGRSGGDRQSEYESGQTSRRSKSRKKSSRRGRQADEEYSRRSSRRRSRKPADSDYDSAGRSDRYPTSSRRSSHRDSDCEQSRRSSKRSRSKRSSRRSEYDDSEYSVSARAGESKSSRRRLTKEDSESRASRRSSSRKPSERDQEDDLAVSEREKSSKRSTSGKSKQGVYDDAAASGKDSDVDNDGGRSSYSRRSYSRRSSYPSASAASEEESRSEVYKGDASRRKKHRRRSNKMPPPPPHYMMPPHHNVPFYNPYYSSCYPPYADPYASVEVEECAETGDIIYKVRRRREKRAGKSRKQCWGGDEKTEEEIEGRFSDMSLGCHPPPRSPYQAYSSFCMQPSYFMPHPYQHHPSLYSMPCRSDRKPSRRRRSSKKKAETAESCPPIGSD